ncbi:ATP-grasp domain-containing protein [Ensifer sp. ENS09]|uniref:ATP-grasp domain-containing protein n=1 Tax=Ensifer sp. ENS09 TaxID=2769263 RepID=UPI00177C86B5|nr:ATP-grasp domain-containing protein [Ensifer sp. ENS09]MBD9653006.1 ATP-grasp domain-containing protein [Ensifer sp. ENS09]
MTNKKFRILITSAGTATALGVIKALAHRPEFEIHTADVNSQELLAIGAFPVMSHSVVPYATDRDKFLSSIDSIIVERDISFVFPIHDEEIRLISAFREHAPNVGFPKFSPQSVSDCTDKYEMTRICQGAGIRVPQTFLAAEYGRSPFFPVVVKPRRGVGSVGFRIVRNDFELEGLDVDKVVLQEVCTGPEVTVDVLATLEGTIAIARERIETKSGVSTKCRIAYSRELADIAASISETFGLEGLFCFQAMKVGESWAVTDINPRSGGGSAMTTAAGINLFEEYFLQQAGYEDVDRFKALELHASSLQPTLVVRYYEEHLSKGCI